jgi:YbgC/YbaW family acyl-CoA thioester hydrolase
MAMGAKHHARERVRWSDVDIGGVIRWDAYARFVEIAETELFRAIGFPYATLWDTLDIWLPRVQYHVDMRSPVRLDDLLETEIRVGSVGRSSVRLEFAVSSAGERVADGHLVIVAIHRRSGKSVAVPDPLRAALER